jgi:hypothetical protein
LWGAYRGVDQQCVKVLHVIVSRRCANLSNKPN